MDLNRNSWFGCGFVAVVFCGFFFSHLVNENSE